MNPQPTCVIIGTTRITFIWHTHKPQVLHGAVRTAQLTGKLILPENGRREVFMNLGELYALNFDLLKELEDRIEHW